MTSAGKAGVRVAAAPTIRELHQSMVTIRIGPAKHPFVVHKERLCHYSAYFKAALTGSFMESANGIVELPDQDLKVFESVEHWLYTKKLTQDTSEDIDFWHSRLFKIYVFSDRFCMPLLKNAVVDAIIADDDRMAHHLDIEYVYKNTHSDSPLRRLLVTMFAYNIGAEWFRNYMDHLPQEFVREIALLNISRLPPRLPDELAPFEENVCQFHEHSNSTGFCAAKHKNAKKRKLNHCS